MLEQKRQELLSEQAGIDDQLSRLSSFILTKKEGDYMNYQAVVKELPECIVYSKKLRVPSYDSYFELIPEIGREVLKANPNMKCAVPEYCFIVYLDGEYKEKDFNIEYCEAVTEKGVDIKDIIFKEIRSETAVTVMHKGNYESLPKAYAFIFQWIEDNDYKPTGLARENYIDGIWNKKSSDDWLTEIQVPISKN